MAEDLGTIELEFTGGEPAQVRRQMRRQGESISGGISSGAAGIGGKIAGGLIAALSAGALAALFKNAFSAVSRRSGELSMFSGKLMGQRIQNYVNEFLRTLQSAKRLGPLFAEFERQREVLRQNSQGLRDLWDAIRVETMTAFLKVIEKAIDAVNRWVNALFESARVVVQGVQGAVLNMQTAGEISFARATQIFAVLAGIDAKFAAALKILRETRDATEATNANEFMLQDFNFMAERNIVPGIVTPGLPMPAAP